jgi:Skp family chaperone for outer membrane proteins
MRVRLGYALTLTALLTAAPAAAQEMRGLKVGIVITARLLTSTEIGQNAAETLRGKKDSAQTQLDSKAGEITELKKDLEKRLMVLNAEEKGKAREEFERKSRDGLRLKEDLERELQKQEQEVLGEVNELLSKVVIEYGKSNDYDLILDASSALYFSDAPDITDEIIAEANRAYKK